MSRISTELLVSLVMLVAAMVVYVAEAMAYYRLMRWYYRAGPAIVHERWQTSADIVQVRAAIRPLLDTSDFVGRESSEGFCFRQRTASVNAWTRFMLRIEETECGVALHYEIRPFYSFILLFIPVLGLSASNFKLGGLAVFSVAGPTAFAVVFMIYKWIMPWDISRMDRLPIVRRALAPYGLLVCERCGYDLCGHTDARRCPECGSENSGQ